MRIAMIVGVGLAILAGCATQHALHNAPSPKNDIAECQRLTAEALSAVTATLHSLEEVNALTNRCPNRLFDQLERDERRLHTDSLRLRARVEAMRARREAYFEQWHDHLNQMKDPEARDRAARLRPQLQQGFARMREIAQPTREAFRPFVADVRKLLDALEISPASTQEAATKELLRAAIQNGQKVEQGVASILHELDAVAGLLKPVKTTAAFDGNCAIEPKSLAFRIFPGSAI